MVLRSALVGSIADYGRGGRPAMDAYESRAHFS